MLRVVLILFCITTGTAMAKNGTEAANSDTLEQSYQADKARVIDLMRKGDHDAGRAALNTLIETYRGKFGPPKQPAQPRAPRYNPPPMVLPPEAQ
jgi:hypothetical protein